MDPKNSIISEYKMNRKPRIGVTRSHKRDRIPYYCIKFVLWLCGAKTILLTPNKPQTDKQLDGLILSGGIDIHLSGPKTHRKENYPYEPERDKLEYDMLQIAQAAKIPILGICRGAQLINLSRQGTLHFDVARAYEKAKYPSSLLAKIAFRKRMYPIKDSLIYKIIGDNRVKINSIHSQSIDLLGNNLIITAQEKNKVVQVIEDPRFDFLLGVQFHPELLIYHKYFRKIFSTFVKAAKKHMGH